MFYSYKNFNVKINNTELVASSASLSQQNSVVPRYELDNRHAVGYYNEGILQGKANLTYYLTGNDPIKQFINDETNTISGNFGGLYFSTGYLSAYRVNMVPNTPVVADAEIVFFSPVLGEFVPESVATDTGSLLNTADITIGQGIFSEEVVDTIQSVQYNYTCELTPSITIGDTGNIESHYFPRMVFGRKTINAEVVTDSISGFLPISGRNMDVTITLKHPHVAGITEDLDISGVIVQKNLSSSENEIVKNVYSITQSQFKDTPTVSSFDPAVAAPGEYVKINGQGFLNTIEARVGDYKLENLVIVSDTLMSGVVPLDVISGNITVKTFGGQVSSASKLDVGYHEIKINSISPLQARQGEEILISGSGFHNITEVDFSGFSGSFKVINNNLIQAVVPTGARWGNVTVSAQNRFISGSSPYFFVPYPVINGFTPTTGVSGQLIVMSGYNLFGITGASVSGLFLDSVTETNGTGVTAVMTSGNTRDLITVYGPSGVTGVTPSKFNPIAGITGIDPLPAQSGDVLTISGFNFVPPLMYSTGADPDLFFVLFNGLPTEFKRLSDIKMTGAAPNVSTGPVYLFQEDGACTYDESIQVPYVRTPDPPVITKVTPQVIYDTQTLNAHIAGTGFIQVENVRISGVYPTATSTGNFQLTDHNFRSDVFGNNINITGYVLQTNTGQYTVYVEKQLGSGIRTGAFIVKNPPNIALEGSATQSSTFDSINALYGPSRAIDDELGTFSSTQLEDGAWWKVDLGKTYSIGKIVINAISGAHIRLSGTSVAIMHSNDTTYDYSGNFTGYPEVTRTIYPNPGGWTTGQYVKIQHTGGWSNYLEMSEVEIY